MSSVIFHILSLEPNPLCNLAGSCALHICTVQSLPGSEDVVGTRCALCSTWPPRGRCVVVVPRTESNVLPTKTHSWPTPFLLCPHQPWCAQGIFSFPSLPQHFYIAEAAPLQSCAGFFHSVNSFAHTVKPHPFHVVSDTYGPVLLIVPESPGIQNFLTVVNIYWVNVFLVEAHSRGS